MKDTISISIALHVGSSGAPDAVERVYDSSLKRLFSFLYEQPQLRLAAHFSGPELGWLKQEHPEFIQLLRELVARKQLELLGGGYYNPAFPLLFPQDRTGQLELLTSELSHSVGKRPRGCLVYGSIWDPSIIPSLQSCGMEYVVLDESLLREEQRRFLPLVVHEYGRLLKVFPASGHLLPQEGETAAEMMERLCGEVIHRRRGEDGAAVVLLPFSAGKLSTLLADGWLSAFLDQLREQQSPMLRLPLECLHGDCRLLPVYVGPGLSEGIARWARQQDDRAFPVTVHDFLSGYPRNRALYSRTLYISTLISQARGDKARRQQAREHLWAAQTAKALVCNPRGIFATGADRQAAYRHLTEAEKLLREAGPKDFKETVTSYDYDCDGHAEYLCRMAHYTACVTGRAGSICEFDVLHTAINYVDNFSRIARFDGADDGYERGLFIDHLLTAEEFADYRRGRPAGAGVFAAARYCETGFEGTRHEIRLRADGIFGAMRLPVSLRKHYVANSSGITVQYILKNDSPLRLQGRFVVESNFAQTDFADAETNSYTAEVVSQGQRQELDARAAAGTLSSVSYLQVTDTASNISFVYELNEDASVTCMPLRFCRPAEGSSVPQVVGTTFVASLCWEVNLAAGMEMEKTVNCTIIVPKKRKTARRT